MKLSMSNIAWNASEDINALNLLKKFDVQGVEIAPTVLWGPWSDINYEDVKIYKKQLTNQFNFSVPALQAIMFGRQDLDIFSSDHQPILSHFRVVCKISNLLECPVLIFGAPKNRQRGSLTIHKATDLAIQTFRKLADLCYNEGITIGLEPNPPGYGCDFINTSDEAINLCNQISHPSFKIHVDFGAIQMNQENLPKTLKQNTQHCAHMHISQPYLEGFSSEATKQFHSEAARILKDLQYNKWVSIEMKRLGGLNDVEKALHFVKEVYFTP